MKRVSLTERLTLGLGVIVVGVCLSVPFLHHSAPEITSAADAAGNQMSLGQGVSLQVPGQTTSPPLAAKPPEPWAADAESTGTPDASDPASGGPEAAQITPPALPDQYRPLFKPSLDSDGPSSGRVGRRTSPPVPRKPLKKHTIHDGDTLESLAARYLGDARRAGEILQANRAVLTDPQLLPIGLSITIPPADPSDAPADPASAAGRQDDQEAPRLVPLPKGGWGRAP